MAIQGTRDWEAKHQAQLARNRLRWQEKHPLQTAHPMSEKALAAFNANRERAKQMNRDIIERNEFKEEREEKVAKPEVKHPPHQHKQHHDHKVHKRKRGSWSMEPDSECAAYLDYDAESETLSVDFVKRNQNGPYEYDVDRKTARELKRAAEAGETGELLNDEIPP